MQVSVARYLRTPPYAAKRKGLSFGYPSCLRSQSDRSTVVVGNCTFGPITVVPHRAKAGLFSRSSILFRPPPRPTSGVLVEPPGTAPGSDPIITGAFIAIVRANPNIPDIGRGGALRKGGAAQQKGPDALGGPGLCTGRGRDQKPALMASNSSIILVRNSVGTGVWAKSVVFTGSTKAAFSASSGTVFIAASFARA